MKSRITRILAIAAIGLFAACASATSASAQVYKGKFTLPTEVRWQGKNLPAGDYTFSLKSVALPAQVLIDGPNGYAFVLTTATDDRVTGEKSFLTVQQTGAGRFIREMYLADLGLRLHYDVPRPAKDEQRLVQGPSTTERILIAANTNNK
jgi:hypothetical protein